MPTETDQQDTTEVVQQEAPPEDLDIQAIAEQHHKLMEAAHAVDLNVVKLLTMKDFSDFLMSQPEELRGVLRDRAMFFYLKAREKRTETFITETVDLVKGLYKRLTKIEKLFAAATSGAGGEGEDEDAPPAPAAPQAGNDGPGYAPVDNLPFATSPAEAEAQGKTAVNQPGGTVVGTEATGDQPKVGAGGGKAPQEGANNSRVTGVKKNPPGTGPLGAGGAPVPNNSRVVNVAPIPKPVNPPIAQSNGTTEGEVQK